jgi:hypothetical protein
MAVKSQTYYTDDDGGAPGPRRRPKRRIGFLSGGSTETAFIWLLRLAGVVLIAVSIVGTFYGLQGKEAEGLLRVIPAMVKGWPWLLAALAAQAFLSVGQWGSRQRAQGQMETKDGKRRRVGGDPRFWLVYLALLVFSAALNWIAYGPHLLEWGIHWALAALAVIIGDALAELVIVADD